MSETMKLGDNGNSDELIEGAPRKIHIWGFHHPALGRSTGWVDAEKSSRRKYEITYIRADLYKRVIEALQQVQAAVEYDSEIDDYFITEDGARLLETALADEEIVEDTE